jgi:methylenetetrahydrofolate reductase (NADPH)
LVHTPTSTPQEQEDKKEATNAASWDDFINGRFGDSTSPAYGALDSWATSGLGVSASEGKSRWGNPRTAKDIQQIFLGHLESQAVDSSTPFSPEPLSAESALIVDQLRKLVNKGWWTVASQPAVDALSSTDPVVGWGPRGGYVFQKAFVECFCEKGCVDWLKEQAAQNDKRTKAQGLNMSFRLQDVMFDMLISLVEFDRVIL